MTIVIPKPIVYEPLTRTDLVRYAGASGDFNPLHHDHEFAAAAGLPDVMTHGMLSAGLLASALTKWFGAGNVRRYGVRFRSPVWPGDILTAYCRSICAGSGEPDRRTADLVLELARQDGEVVLTGTATVLLGAASTPQLSSDRFGESGSHERHSMTSNSTIVRPAGIADREAFLTLWQEFVSLTPGEPGNHTMGELNWDRIMDSTHGLRCIVAVNDDDRPLGFTLFLALPFTWSAGDACYLQDLYVDPKSRGMGVAQAMIAHLREIGLEAGWFKIFWMTQSDNYAAQRLYDKVAKRMDYLRYDLNICEP